MTLKTISKPRQVTCAVLMSAMAVAGCDEAINLTPGAVDKADICSPFRQQIADARKSDLQQQANAAVAGALIGAVLGAAVAGSGNRAQGALLGATIGGLAGYSDVYYKQVAKRSRDASSLLGNVNSDAGKERALVTQTGRATASLRSCRSRQLSSLRSRVRGGKVTKSAAKAELRQIRGWAAQDNRLVSAAFNGIGQRVDAYVDVTNGVARTQSSISAAGARKRTPNVSRVKSERTAQINSAKRSEERVNSEIKALEVLLG